MTWSDPALTWSTAASTSCSASPTRLILSATFSTVRRKPGSREEPMVATAYVERTSDGAYDGIAPDAAWRDEVLEMARRRDAVILAHNYQLPEIQDIAHHAGDSLALSRIAAASDASTIVFCGVHFMAETAKILAPQKTVLIPDERAGCSLADSITGAQLREWKAQHPGAVVVSYVNTTARSEEHTSEPQSLLYLVCR